MNVKTFNTLPNPKDHFWQVVLLPTISVLRSPDVHEAYTAINCEWLFWSVTFLIKDNE